MSIPSLYIAAFTSLGKVIKSPPLSKRKKSSLTPDDHPMLPEVSTIN